MALIIIVTCRQFAHAADYRRVAPGSGSFTNANLWSPAGVPGGADRAIFDLSSQYTVSFPFNPFPSPIIANDRMRIGDDDVTFDLNGRIYSLTSTSSTSLSIGGNARLFGNTPENGRLFVTDGIVAAEGVMIGAGADIGLGTQGWGAIYVRGGTLISNGLLAIGGATPGTLVVDDGGDVFSSLATIGTDAIGSAYVSGAGTTWTSDSIDVGANADGTLVISSSAVDTNSANVTYVGVAPGVTGQVIVGAIQPGGAGGRWDSAGPFIIGHSGIGNLRMENGGVVQSTAANTTTILGNQSGSSAEAKLRHTGTRWVATSSSHRTIVGNLGSASVEVLDGAEVSFGQTSIGAHPVGNGTIVLNGTGTTWNSLAGLFVGGREFIEGGAGTFTIGADARAVVGASSATKIWGPGAVNLNGGTLETGRLERLGGAFNWTTGLLHLTGSTLDAQPGGAFGAALDLNSGQHLRANGVNVGVIGDGTLTAAAGASITADFGMLVGGAADGTLQTSGPLTTARIVTLGDQTGSTGTVSIENGAVWNHSADSGVPLEFIIGSNGIGTLQVRSGAHVTIRDQAVPVLGNGFHGRGTININGPGSEMTVELHDLSIGRMGYGEVNITGGGRLALPASVAFIGDLQGAQGELLVQGTASMLSVGALVVGNFGAGTMNIGAGGSVVGSEIYIALGDTSTGMVTLNGIGSRLSALTGFATLIVGGGSTGSLTISAGARAEAKEVILGDGTSAVGTALVTGTGSRITATEEMAVGYNGLATLTLADGGVAAAPLIAVNHQSSIVGNGTLLGDVFSEGLISPGASPGALTIDGIYEQMTGGELRVQIASAAAFDQLQVTGAATLDGTLVVELLPGFNLSGEHFFTILTASAVNGQFDTELLPSAPNISFDVIYNPTSVVVHVVAPQFAGDYNGDGRIDAADYVLWRKTDGSPEGYNTWRANFGATANGAAAAAHFANGTGLSPSYDRTTVPEPVSSLLIMLAAGEWLAACRRRGAANVP